MSQIYYSPTEQISGGNGETIWPSAPTLPSDIGMELRKSISSEQDSISSPLTLTNVRLQPVTSQSPHYTVPRHFRGPSPLTPPIVDTWLKEKLKAAFYKITDALDMDLSPAEKSNCFDDWKDILSLLSRQGFNLTKKHNQILGGLINASRQKDLFDFSNKGLQAFQEATNLLRQPQLTKADVARIMDRLLDQGLTITLPLATACLGEDGPSPQALEEYINKLLAASREHHEP